MWCSGRYQRYDPVEGRAESAISYLLGETYSANASTLPDAATYIPKTMLAKEIPSILARPPPVLEPHLDNDMNGSMLSRLDFPKHPTFTLRGPAEQPFDDSFTRSGSSHNRVMASREAGTLLREPSMCSRTGTSAFSQSSLGFGGPAGRSDPANRKVQPTYSERVSTKPWIWRVAELGRCGELLPGTSKTVYSSTELADHVGGDRKKISTAIHTAKKRKTEEHTMIVAMIKRRLGTAWTTWMAITSISFRAHDSTTGGMWVGQAPTQLNCLDISIVFGGPTTYVTRDQSECAHTERNSIASESESVFSAFSRSAPTLTSELFDDLGDAASIRAEMNRSQVAKAIHRSWIIWPADLSERSSWKVGQYLHLDHQPASARSYETSSKFAKKYQFRRTSFEKKISPPSRGAKKRPSVAPLETVDRTSYPLILFEAKDKGAGWFAKAHPPRASMNSIFGVPTQLEVIIPVIRAKLNDNCRTGGKTGTLTVGEAFFQHL